MQKVSAMAYSTYVCVCACLPDKVRQNGAIASPCPYCYVVFKGVAEIRKRDKVWTCKDMLLST